MTYTEQQLLLIGFVSDFDANSLPMPSQGQY